MITKQISIRVPKVLHDRLQKLSQDTHRPATFYVREAIEEHLEDIEDTYIAIQRLENREETYTLEEVKKSLDIK